MKNNPNPHIPHRQVPVTGLHSPKWAVPLTPAQKRVSDARSHYENSTINQRRTNKLFPNRYLLLLGVLLLTTVWACWASVTADSMYQPKLWSVIALQNSIIFLPFCAVFLAICGLLWHTCRASRYNQYHYSKFIAAVASAG